ncbi:MAG: DUF3305 domain-containing protein [Kiloniellaceae bacterium]
MEKSETIPLGVVIERRRSNHPWSDFAWRPIAVIPGAAALNPRDPWTRLREGDGWIQFHSGTLQLELFRAETESYRINLAQTPPRIFVVLRGNDDPEIPHELLAFLVTASPFEAQHYLDSGEEIVEAVPMPEEIVALVQDFVDAHHREEVFTKRRRNKAVTGDDAFSRRPPVAQPALGRSGRSRVNDSGER